MQTKDNKVLAVKELTWDDVVEKLSLVNPSLEAIMDKLRKRSDNYTFYQARYPYGSKIIKDKKTFLPLENGDSIAFDDSQLPDSIRNNLLYNPATEDPFRVNAY